LSPFQLSTLASGLLVSPVGEVVVPPVPELEDVVLPPVPEVEAAEPPEEFSELQSQSATQMRMQTAGHIIGLSSRTNKACTLT